MTHTELRKLFAEALTDEPVSAPVDEDLARGRTLAARRRRRRVGGGLAAVATVAAALVLPFSPAAHFDSGGSGVTVATGGAEIDPSVADDPMLLAMWEAVEAVLPDDVEVADEVGNLDPIGLYLPLIRDGEFFTASVWVADNRFDTREIQACQYTQAEFYDMSSCEHGIVLDETRRRLAAGTARAGGLGVTFVEGGSASVAMAWERYSVPEGDRDAQPTGAASALPEEQELTGNLTASEANKIADAVWMVAAAYDEADLASGIDLEATLDLWDELHEALESALGPLTTIEPPTVTSLSAARAETITARYRLADDAHVDVLIWQKERLYDQLCLDDICRALPGITVGSAARPELGIMTELGQRAGLEIWVDSTDLTVDQGLEHARWELEQLIPRLDSPPS